MQNLFFFYIPNYIPNLVIFSIKEVVSKAQTLHCHKYRNRRLGEFLKELEDISFFPNEKSMRRKLFFVESDFIRIFAN